MILDTSGRVGINRTPSITNSKLEVGGADNVSLINVEASGVTGGIGIGSPGLKFFHGSTNVATVDSGGNFNAIGDVVSNGGATKIGGTSTVFTNSSFLITQTAQTVVPRSAITSLPTGTYLMTIFLNGGGWYTSRLTGIVQHYNGTTNSTSTSNNTIHLTGSGHALNAGILQARYQTFLSNANNHGVQIWSSSQVTTSASITFKRLS